MEEQRKKSTGFGTTGFVLSIVGVIILFFFSGTLPALLALIFGILGLIFCIIQFKKGRTGLATAGLIISIILILIGLFIIISWYFVKSAMEEGVDWVSSNLPS